MNGKHIEIFLVDGVAGGLTTAEIAGWTGHLLTGPRSELARILSRDEAQRNGAYILLGADPDAVEQTRAYVGRTENFASRIRVHDSKKEFWDRLVIMTAKDDTFNEGHWGYLEARLHDQASVAKRCGLDNINKPQGRQLSEAQRSDMEFFFAQLEVVLPVLGVNILRRRKITPSTLQEAVPSLNSPIFRMVVGKNGIDARAQVVDGVFYILEDSRVAPRWMGKAKAAATERSYENMKNMRNGYINDGSIRVEGDTAVVTRDIACSSSSNAGMIVAGRSCNGRREWVWDGGTYADWEERELTPPDRP